MSVHRLPPLQASLGTVCGWAEGSGWELTETDGFDMNVTEGQQNLVTACQKDPSGRSQRYRVYKCL